MLKPGKQKRKKDKDRYKRLQTEVQYESRKAGKKYMTDVICDKDNTNKLWSYIKSKGREFIAVAPLKNQQGFLKVTSKAKLIFLTSSLNQSLPMKTIQTFRTKDQVHFHQ